MYEPAHVLFAVIETAFWSMQKVQSWADNLIMELATPATWLTKLSLSSSQADAAAAVLEALNARGRVLPEAIDELLVGLLSLRHRASDLAHDEFDAEVADVLDAYDSRLSIEAWVELQGNASEQDKLESILQRFEARASAAVGELEDTARLKLHPFFHEVG